MRHLSVAARILTPLAMVVFLSYELSQSLAVTGLWYIALLIGSVCTAVGIEIVGILAGHTLEGYWRIGDAWRGLLSFALLLAYTVTAVYILAGTSLVIVPIIAAIVYILASLTDGLETAVNRQEVATAVNQSFDLEQRSKDRDVDRQIKLEKARAKLTQPTAQPKETRPVAPELSGKALEIYTLLKMQPGATDTQVGESVGVSRQYVGKVRKELNGSITAVRPKGE